MRRTIYTSPMYDALDPIVVAPFFWRWVAADEPDRCWFWLGRFSGGNCGYGRLTWQGKSYSAARVAWIIAHGAPSARGMMILHHCDNTACVNPHHLYAGTAQDNARDATERSKKLPPGELEARGLHACARVVEERLTRAAELIARDLNGVPAMRKVLRPLVESRVIALPRIPPGFRATKESDR